MIDKLKELSEIIKSDIDFHCSEFYDDGHRTHLGASLIGHDCKLYLWYVFRWCFHKKHEGKQQRLFNRGHLEEKRFAEWLRSIGFVVADINPETGKQWKISDCNGHFGGSLDGKALFPQHYKFGIPVLLEYKTHGAGKDGKGKVFDKLVEKGLEAEKFQHFAQTCVYGYKEGLEYCLYLSINKNNDELHVELVKLDMALGKQMIAKAEQIINQPSKPNRISDNPNFYKCKMCDMRPICHEMKQIEKNCRSCSYAQPIHNGQWGCNLHNQIIPKDFIPLGCENWNSIV